MTDWTTIPVSTFDADEPVLGSTHLAMYQNFFALASGASNAPPIQSAWHPYNMAVVGDGNDGLIYDHAVDGALSQIETPVFEPGYEYMVRFEAISGSSNSTLLVACRNASSGIYETPTGLTIIVNSTENIYGMFRVVLPSVPQRGMQGIWEVRAIDNNGVGNDVSSGAANIRIVGGSSVLTVDRMRFSRAAGNFDAGKLYLLRRREYVSG